jgi:6-phosphofructokinase 2
MNEVAPITTLTFNPCIDKSTSVAALVAEKKLKCSAPHFQPGGGGINIARAVKKLGGEALAIYPAGGYSGKFLKSLLENEGISCHCIETKSHSRENLIVLDESKNAQYRFGMPGQQLEEAEWMQCVQAFNSEKSIYKVVSGSWSPGLPPAIIGKIAEAAKQENKKLVVDTSGEPLRLALESGVYMIKPNLGELCTLFDTKANAADAAGLAKKIIQSGKAEIVIVSLGPEGAILVTENTTMRLVSPKVKKLSTVGAGDSMVAGIVWKLSNGFSVLDAVKYGVACGTAATMNAGSELCHLDDADKLYQKVELQEVE